MRGLRDTPHNAGATAAELLDPVSIREYDHERPPNNHPLQDRWMSDIVLRGHMKTTKASSSRCNSLCS